MTDSIPKILFIIDLFPACIDKDTCISNIVRYRPFENINIMNYLTLLFSVTVTDSLCYENVSKGRNDGTVNVDNLHVFVSVYV